jgi:hypothetical protein
VRADYPGPGKTPQVETREFATLSAYADATGQDRHSVLVDYSIFEHVPRLDAADIASLQNIYDAADLDFSLKRGAAAIDRGLA